MAAAHAKEIATNGWAAVPVDASKIFKGMPFTHKPEPLLVRDIKFPSEDPLVAKIQGYAKQHLPVPIYNHSMRAYYFASTIIKQQFPDKAVKLSPSTLALTCLLHDLGASPENLTATHMSFEFYGAIKSLSVLQESGSPKDQAEAVAEAIIRHQDIGTEGNITFLAQVIQLATIYDNVGQHPTIEDFAQIIHETTLVDVNKEFPRMRWLSCFADTLRMEVQSKPWCHTTHIPNAAEHVENSQLMKPYE